MTEPATGIGPLDAKQQHLQEQALAFAPYLHAWIISGRPGSFIVARRKGEIPSLQIVNDYIVAVPEPEE